MRGLIKLTNWLTLLLTNCQTFTHSLRVKRCPFTTFSHHPKWNTTHSQHSQPSPTSLKVKHRPFATPSTITHSLKVKHHSFATPSTITHSLKVKHRSFATPSTITHSLKVKHRSFATPSTITHSLKVKHRSFATPSTITHSLKVKHRSFATPSTITHSLKVKHRLPANTLNQSVDQSAPIRFTTTPYHSCGSDREWSGCARPWRDRWSHHPPALWHRRCPAVGWRCSSGPAPAGCRWWLDSSADSGWWGADTGPAAGSAQPPPPPHTMTGLRLTAETGRV